MEEPWNIRQDDTRFENHKPTFIIFCEDGAVEPEYFNAFATSQVQISLIRNSGKHHKQVDYATEECRKTNSLEILEDGREKLKLDEGAQLWCVFDRDKEPNDGLDSSFNSSIVSAESKGIKTAWSNDDFELWILLHFETVPTDDTQYKNREKYYERLTEVLKALESKTPEEAKVIDSERFSYRFSMKNKKRFIAITLQHMKGKTQTAVDRAKTLELYHSKPPKAHHEKCPCTKVHHLVLELIAKGGKPI